MSADHLREIARLRRERDEARERTTEVYDDLKAQVARLREIAADALVAWESGHREAEAQDALRAEIARSRDKKPAPKCPDAQASDPGVCYCDGPGCAAKVTP